MSTRTDLANIALLRMGVSQQLVDLDTDISREAVSCRLLFDVERMYVLRDFPWPWARKWHELTLHAGSEAAPANPDWIYGYLWPDDCVFVRRILNAFGRQAVTPPPFVIGRAEPTVVDGPGGGGGTPGGRRIYTNQTTAMAEYTVDITDVEEFDPIFCSMFCWRLAAQLALSLARMPDIAKSCLEMYAAERGQAMTLAVAEGEYAIASGEADPAVREIFQLALTRIGIARNVAAVDPELTFVALWPRVSFAGERDYVLRDFPWPFATKYETLTIVTGSLTVRTNFDWQFAYLYPANCVYMRRLVTAAGRLDLKPPPFKIGSGIINPDAAVEAQVRGRLIYTNAAEAIGEYTEQITDTAEFDPIFTSLLAWRIAALLAPSISKTKLDAAIPERAMRMYEIEKSRAQRSAANESQGEDAPEAESIRGRA